MSKRPSSGHTKRDLFPGQGAGKGDADRSPGWREHYDEINWGRPTGESLPGKRFFKIYGTPNELPFEKGPHIKIL